MNTEKIKFFIGKYENEILALRNDYKKSNIAKRIFEKDHTVWAEDPNEITNRLDWLNSPEETLSKIEEINLFVSEVKGKFKNVLLLGMGGSSLAPEVFSLSFGTKDEYLHLEVLDSTDPGYVKHFTEKFDPKETLYIVSTKSGGTIETLSFFKYFYTYCKKAIGESVGTHFVAITDPGSKLQQMAKELEFRKTFLNNPNIGGRYSVLSYFGTVPAALLGVDLEKLLSKSKFVANECQNEISVSGDIGLVMAYLAKHGRDKLTFIYSDKIKSFGTWVEQLIAESTGKNGVGILPIESEELLPPEFYKNDRVFVYTHFNNDNKLIEQISALKESGHPVIEIVLDDVYDLGAEFYRWEFATAVSGWVLGIQPFDQPNVESAKIEARAMISSYLENGKLPELGEPIEDADIKLYGETKENKLVDAINSFLKQLNDDKYNYVAIMGYVTPTPELIAPLHELRTRIQKKYNVAVTTGYGPRFLHSTGQLHKGDGGNGLFIQLKESIKDDVSIPSEPGSEESEYTFGILITAQLLGDRQALLNSNRKVITIDLGKETVKSLEKITEMI